ncbi:hypothetical protein M422DRAFT_68403 [Sphaerobolus stellatus SS14]|uniref:Terpene synthase n=1 Tax=Sphaerobolus stellatus (strain SS14) TaxID=990650 RepID=A0A0C9VRX8_SPHS4|nr:hypothetical protein M422DRAFT_68403 [Sphaerobolus stellatus SS14]
MLPPAGFFLPDLWSHCPYPAIYHPNGDALIDESDEWMITGCVSSNRNAGLRRAMPQILAGKLAAFCYNNCSDERFRIVADFNIWLFFMDDLSDEFKTDETELFLDIVMNAMEDTTCYRPGITNGEKHPQVEPDASLLARDWWARMSAGSGPDVQRRIIKGVKEYLVAVRGQAEDRRTGNIPELEKYIVHRRLSSGCRPLFDIIEFSLDFQLPAEVVSHPLMVKMKDCVNEWVAFSNDIYSYKIEHARGDKHNMVAVMMERYKFTIQDAVDRVADHCIEAAKIYQECKANFPSFGAEVDSQVEEYCHVLQSWMSGCLAWSFVTPRYLGPKRNEIRKTLWVDLIEGRGPRSINAA